jgi:uncharacterized protein involved in exopolysaccharide biosynthesis
MSNVAQFAKETAEAAANEKPPEQPKEEGGRILEDKGDNKDYGKAASLIAKIEAEQTKIDKHAEDYKRKCAPHRDAMKALKKQIRDDEGIEAKALSALLADRRQKRRMTARVEHLEEPAASQFKQLEMAL